MKSGHHAILLRGNDVSVVPSAYQVAGTDVFHSINDTLGVDEVRTLQVIAYQKGTTSARVIVVVAKLLTREAQNALLKILEEPPAGVRFFLVTPQPQQLLPTVRSRLAFEDTVPDEAEGQEVELFTAWQAVPWLSA